MPQSENTQVFLGLTADIISAHVKNNNVDAADLPKLIERVYLALRHAGAASPPAQSPVQPQAAPAPERPAQVAPPKKSIFPDYIICLEDGRKMKTLKRYLRSTHNMTPEQYREKWGLPADYPMVAPNYAEHRSVLAKQAGLGRKRKSEAGGAKVEAPATNTPAAAPVVIPPVTPAAPFVREAPPRESRSDHTAASVFLNFPRSKEEPQEEPDAPPEGEARKPRRKPFSKQLARGMRR